MRRSGVLLGVNTVAHTGIHDNNTMLGWLASLDERDRRHCLHYMGLVTTGRFGRRFLEMLLGARAQLAIVTMQDLLALGGEARMNTPSTQGGNWTWRMLSALAQELRRLTRLCGRGSGR